MLEGTEYVSIKLLKYVKDMYKIPRFGHSQDFTKFFSDSKTEQNDYMQGLILAFSLMMIIAAVWFVALIILRVLGHRVGCASGKPATIPAEPMGDKSGSVNTNETGEFIVMQADQNRVNRTRIAFFIAVLYTLAACGVLIYSLVVTQNSTQEFYEYAEDVRDSFAAVPANLSTFMESSSTFTTSIADSGLIAELSTFCPDSASVGGVDPSKVAADFGAALSEIDVLNSEATLMELSTSVAGMNDELSDAVEFMSFMKGPGEPWFWVSVLLAGVLAFLTLYLLASAWKAGKEGYEFVGETEENINTKILDFVAIPLFAALVAAAWFGASTAFTASAANADFCVAEISNGDTVLNILQARGFEESSLFYRSADEYLHGCVGGELSHIPAADGYDASLTTAKDLDAIFAGFDVNELDGACFGDANVMMATLTKTSAQLSDLATEFGAVYNNISCEHLAPIVQNAVYTNSCHSLSSGFLWTFASALTVAAFGTILLTLRSATSRPQIYLVPAGQSDDNSYIIGDEDSYGY
eukprot:CAMPEP_0194081380 /NCGR_PEP_ID=MMETSP0149-20130528/7175_1 /TAXON_ID=122233 /ORGANISM="Chaetoceros debilis, Strain MM31A-1" /LENGTH=525 /DNA_ID=CAMNT_0038763289 /DNA_START=130 /DNA_END=1707 /DNA_ORIENTATION=+